MNEHELDDAKHVSDGQDWAPLLVASLTCLAVLAYAWQDELIVRALYSRFSPAPQIFYGFSFFSAA